MGGESGPGEAEPRYSHDEGVDYGLTVRLVV